MHNRTLFIHASSPLHVGVGQGHDLIDLPIARERATRHPILPGSGLKGMLRQAARRRFEEGGEARDGDTWSLFGPGPDRASDYHSALRFSDARLLLFPMASDQGSFAWVTSPLILARLLRDSAQSLGEKLPSELPEVEDDRVLVTLENRLADAGGEVHLGGVAMGARKGLGAVEDWARVLAGLVFPDNPHWGRLLRERLVVASDEVMSWAVESHTEVRARIRVDPGTGTVAKGGLWYEESLPAEAVLCCQVQAVSNGRIGPSQALERLSSLLVAPLSLGGNATVGHGRVQLHLHGGR